MDNDTTPASNHGNLCDFCRPRILDFSKLGWVEKTDAQGNTFLEPEIITTRDGEIVLKPWKDENAFGTSGDDFPDFYKQYGERTATTKGIQVSGRDIKVEYFRNDRCLEASSKAGCRFCDMLEAFLQPSRYLRDISSTSSTCLWSVQYHFEPQVALGLGNLDGGPRLRLHSIVVEYQSGILTNTFKALISASSNTRTADVLRIQGSPLISDILAPANIQLISGWLEECQASEYHLPCQKVPSASSSTPPARLLEIRRSDGSDTVRLIESKEVNDQYATLSHCWGTADGKPPLTTTQANLTEHMTRIAWADLPSTFQLVIKLARSLQIRYLWIDSICIVQDDPEEWKVEAANMSSVYRNSFLTFATVGAKSSHDELQIRTQPHQWVPIPWVFPQKKEFRGEYYVDGNLPEVYNILPLDLEWPDKRFEDVEASHWNSRGWTFQERILSRRVLFLGKHACYWECQIERKQETLLRIVGWDRQLDWVKIGGIDENPRWILSGETEMQFRRLAFEESEGGVTIQQLHELWYYLVAKYTKRKLTFERDLIIALGGLAREMARQLQKIDPRADTTYLSGTWQADIIRGLLWYKKANQYYLSGEWLTFFPPRDQLPKTTPCASWLWRSVEDSKINNLLGEKGMVEYKLYPPSACESTEIKVKSIAIEAPPGDADPLTFPDTKGSIVLSGKFVKIPFLVLDLATREEKPEYWGNRRANGQVCDIKFMVEGNGPGNPVSRDDFFVNWTQADFDSYEAGKLEIFGLLVARGDTRLSREDAALMVVRDGVVDGMEQWRRIGLAVFCLEMDLSWEDKHYERPVPSPFEEAERRTIVIV